MGSKKIRKIFLSTTDKIPKVKYCSTQTFLSITASGFGLKGEILLCRIFITHSPCIAVHSHLFSVLHLCSRLFSISISAFCITFCYLFHITYLGSSRVELNHHTELSTWPDYISPFLLFYVLNHLRTSLLISVSYCLLSHSALGSYYCSSPYINLYKL